MIESNAKDHALVHGKSFGNLIEQIAVQTLTFEDLFALYELESVELLITDTEGLDAKVIQTFPFELTKPRQILFEFKHSDGFLSIGRNFSDCLLKLVDLGYQVSPVDEEDCLAVLKT